MIAGNRLLRRLGAGLLWLTLALAALGMVLHPGGGYAWASYFDSWLVRVIWFSIYQALLSATLSLLLAWPFAWALSQTPFRGQWLLAAFLNLAFILPVLAVVLGVVSLFGQNGWVTLPGTVYGLPGILLAHVALNLPFATRLLWDRLSQIPDHQKRLAEVLGMGLRHRLRWLEWPLIRMASGPVFVLIALLCFSSFTVILTLGGGPANTNLEVAVYQALKYEFDSRAAMLYAVLHGALALTAIGALGQGGLLNMEAAVRQPRGGQRGPSPLQWCAILGLLALLLSPYAALLDRALQADWHWPARLPDALRTSLGIAVFSSVCAVLLALSRCLPGAVRTRRSRWLDFGVLVIPAMVLTTGLFLLCLRLGWAREATWPLIIWVNALMAMPLILQPLKARIQAAHSQYHRLTRVLGMRTWPVLRLVYWPLVRPVMLWALALSAVLSLGDMGVAALVGQVDFVTLPLLIYQSMGSYQMTLAAQMMVVLLALCASLLLLAEWARGRYRAGR
ncbi:ABC transporter permease subunit [Saccharospirillum salsuginis]|uniref:Thiamine/thiamine pyrophosphate ABC transporter, permease protein n=1 Tax=Saccharospirillum salsuginis TaxID=418750 RepID=A0A918N4V6_9GAMM|nr:ABC transporter permease subunit [Saccharospirillum salsuginis]GGX39420.1 thiamine/thiamine pyrophosphate ABC transporter, permease protein [Saccharospirillum salsuginis]